MFDVIIIPCLIIFILIVACIERKKVFDIFSEGVTEGLNTVLELFPVLLALCLSVNMLRASGVINFLSDIFGQILELAFIPRELTSLVFLKPISGSSSIALVTDILAEYGTDSMIGLISSTILGTTETSLYIIAIYSGAIKKKISKKLIAIALLGNFLGIFLSTIVCRIIFV